MFGISFFDKDHKQQKVWQTSWGFSTRSVGFLVMVHGDNIGLVLPPLVADIQVVIIPVTSKKAEERDAILALAEQVKAQLEDASIRVQLDDSDHQSHGWKYSHWEQLGTPLRIEIGSQELASKELKCVQRCDGFVHENVKADDTFAMQIKQILEDIQAQMFNKAKNERDSKIRRAKNWDEFMQCLNQKCMVLTAWCGDSELEREVKLKSTSNDDMEDGVPKSGAKALCIPNDFQDLEEGEVCFFTGKKAKERLLWGRSY
jgi:prolyl-tRNA synthetase